MGVVLQMVAAKAVHRDEKGQRRQHIAQHIVERPLLSAELIMRKIVHQRQQGMLPCRDEQHAGHTDRRTGDRRRRTSQGDDAQPFQQRLQQQAQWRRPDQPGE